MALYTDCSSVLMHLNRPFGNKIIKLEHNINQL